jgi:hypothetical protein
MGRHGIPVKRISLRNAAIVIAVAVLYVGCAS